MTNRVANEAFVTLATTDNYVVGALNIAQSLRAVNTNRSLCVMVSKDISEGMRNAVNAVFDHVEVIDLIDSNDASNLQLLNRPELGVTFTKLHCWKLVQYSKCVFLDADCLVLKNVDDLFDREEFSAAPDVGWPDCFNSGVFVFRPSLETYRSLLLFAIDTGSFDGGDQGLLNLYFNNWSVSDASRRLPFVYNMTTNVAYSYAPAFKQFSDKVKIVHFIGARKPWYYTYNTSTQQVSGNFSQYESNYVNQWWRVFSERTYAYLGNDFKERLSTQYTPMASQASGNTQGAVELNFSQVLSNVPNLSGAVVVGSNQHQSLWEQGQIDYTGRDSFDKIQAHLDAQLRKNN